MCSVINKYQIAGVTVNINEMGKHIRNRDYEYKGNNNSAAAEIEIQVNESDIIRIQKTDPLASRETCIFYAIGSIFYERLLNYDGFMLHSSAVILDGKSYLFSAPSGTGKSTHARLWQKCFGIDRVLILNDDKPAIRKIHNEFYSFGTPWSGKSNLNVNKSAPIQGIAFLERSDCNWIHRMDDAEAIGCLLNQTMRQNKVERLEQLLTLLDGLIKSVPIYKMGCTISEEAAITAYTTMSGGKSA